MTYEVLRPCSGNDERQRWHGANKELRSSAWASLLRLFRRIPPFQDLSQTGKSSETWLLAEQVSIPSES